MDLRSPGHRGVSVCSRQVSFPLVLCAGWVPARPLEGWTAQPLSSGSALGLGLIDVLRHLQAKPGTSTGMGNRCVPHFKEQNSGRGTSKCQYQGWHVCPRSGVARRTEAHAVVPRWGGARCISACERQPAQPNTARPRLRSSASKKHPRTASCLLPGLFSALRIRAAIVFRLEYFSVFPTMETVSPSATTAGKRRKRRGSSEAVPQTSAEGARRHLVEGGSSASALPPNHPPDTRLLRWVWSWCLVFLTAFFIFLMFYN